MSFPSTFMHLLQLQETIIVFNHFNFISSKCYFILIYLPSASQYVQGQEWLGKKYVIEWKMQNGRRFFSA